MYRKLRRVIIYGLCILITYSITGCTITSPDANTPDPISNNDNNGEAPGTEGTMPGGEVITEGSAATSRCEDYQLAYAAFMKKVWGTETDDSEQVDSYSLYDIDKDDVPELLVKRGNGEAIFHTIVYSYVGGDVKEIGSFASGHSVLYTWPGENGIMIFMGHMDYEYVTHATILNGEFKNAEVVSDKQIELNYSDPKNFAAGSTYIDEYYTKTTLPIYRYNADQKPCGSVLFTENTKAKNAFVDVLNNKASFYAFSLDSFGDANGLMSMDAFLSAGSIHSYNEDEYAILKYSFLDVNGDGQAELLLQLGTDGSMDVLAILSFDNGKVYCYYDVYAEGFDFLQNGTLQSRNIDWQGEVENPKAIAFYKEEGYTWYVDKSFTDNALPVEWSDAAELLGNDGEVKDGLEGLDGSDDSDDSDGPNGAELPFVPAGWHILVKYDGNPAVAEGDLNKDGIKDKAFIIEENIRAESDAAYDPFPPRNLLIIFGQKDGSYKLSIKTEKAILLGYEGGGFGDPFDDLIVDRGSISLNYFGGSGPRWYSHYGFRYQDNGWYLIGATEGELVEVNGEMDSVEKDYNLLTGDYIFRELVDGKIETTKGNRGRRELINLIDFDPRELQSLLDSSSKF